MITYAAKEEGGKVAAIIDNNMRFILDGEKTPAELVAFLKEGALFRQFDQVLRQIYPKEDLSKRLINGMAEIYNEAPPNTARKVQNWLKGRNVPQNRETLFQICFILGLDERNASKLLGTASETGIHYRNIDELVYAFGLRTGLNYQEALALKEKMKSKYSLQQLQEQKTKQKSIYYTRQVKEAFAQVTQESELEEFICAHGAELGQIHETAYYKFVELMDLLQKPEGLSGEEERKYSVEEVMETYMRMHVPDTKRTKDYTLLQRVIKKYWPNSSSLQNMRKRKEDVSRKVMILLYLVTEAFDSDEDSIYFGDDEEEDADTILEMRLERMNLFLDRYGMNGLDAGNPFDFLVLYAMRTQEGEGVSERMAAVLESLFDWKKVE